MDDRKRHYLESNEYGSNLEYIIDGIEYSLGRIFEYNKKTRGGILDMNLQLEGVYGLALIAMQNYINLTLADCYIASNVQSNNQRKSLEEFSKQAYKEDSLYDNGKTKIELIIALANSYKHRNDLELFSHRILSNKELNPSAEYKKAYYSTTTEVLSAFNLIESDDWELYPVVKGLEILDKDLNLYNIINHLFNSWHPNLWKKVYERLNSTSSPNPSKILPI